MRPSPPAPVEAPLEVVPPTEQENEQEKLAAYLIGAVRVPLGPGKRPVGTAQDHAMRAAAILQRHGFSSLQAVVDAARNRVGRELVDIINDGIPLDSLDRYLAELKR